LYLVSLKYDFSASPVHFTFSAADYPLFSLETTSQESYYSILHLAFRALNLFVMPLVKCPTCGREAEYTGNEFRPFCSERCKLIDFGAWADEEFALPAETETLSEEDLVTIERELNNDKTDKD
jgi:hypothetical protein